MPRSFWSFFVFLCIFVMFSLMVARWHHHQASQQKHYIQRRRESFLLFIRGKPFSGGPSRLHLWAPIGQIVSHAAREPGKEVYCIFQSLQRAANSPTKSKGLENGYWVGSQEYCLLRGILWGKKGPPSWAQCSWPPSVVTRAASCLIQEWWRWLTSHTCRARARLHMEATSLPLFLSHSCLRRIAWEAIFLKGILWASWLHIGILKLAMEGELLPGKSVNATD